MAQTTFSPQASAPAGVLPLPKRLTWGQMALAIILVLQVLMTLQMRNTPHQDEALYIEAGRNIITGQTEDQDYNEVFSGLPYLYPVAAGLVDFASGLYGVRLLSLVFLIVTTVCVWRVGQNIFEDETIALLGAAVFALQPSTLMLGHYATYDAMSLAYIAVAAATATSAAHREHVYPSLLVGLLLVLGIMTKYASALFVPPIIVMYGWLTLREHQHYIRAFFGAAVMVVLVACGLIVLLFAFDGVLEGLMYTTVAREAFITTSRTEIIWNALGQAGGVFLIALIGFIAMLRRKPIISLMLFGTALLAPAYHVYSQEMLSMNKHIGFGLVFASPLIAFGILALGRFTQEVTRNWWLMPLAVMILMTGFGLQHGKYMFGWNNSSELMRVLRTVARPEVDTVLTDESELLQYTTNGFLEDDQIVNMYWWDYYTEDETYVYGDEAYITATEEKHFDVIVLGYNPGVAHEDALLGMEPYLNDEDYYELVYSEDRWWADQSLEVYRKTEASSREE